MRDKKKIYNYIKAQINPFGRPYKGNAYELGLKIMNYIENMDGAEESFLGNDVTGTNVGGKWIPCSERLPENDKKVLCYVESSMRVGDDIVTGSQHDGLWFMQSGVGMQSFSKACTVTAWMPLSGPYREEE